MALVRVVVVRVEVVLGGDWPRWKLSGLQFSWMALVWVAVVQVTVVRIPFDPQPLRQSDVALLGQERFPQVPRQKVGFVLWSAAN